MTTRSTDLHVPEHRWSLWARPTLAVAATVAMASLFFATAATAQTQAKSPVVVKAATRGSFGSILVNASGGTLYRDSMDKPNKRTCTGSCLTVWPPLVLPKGDTTPQGGKGIKDLGTIPLPGGRLQVTYHKEPLYTFASDSGHSVKGNGVGPFEVVPAP
jgi:predicted lipoprotein with Yx(FWY)xxD motif